jgi:elongation factor P
MASINAGNIAKGMFMMYKDQPHQVMKADFMAPGKGSPIMRVKYRSVKTGAASEFTYKTNESVEVAEVEKKEMQFLYRDGENVVFMDQKTFEQANVPVALIADQVGYLIADMKCWIMWYDGVAIGVSLPPHVDLKVIEAPDAVAGNRVNAPKKLVKVETGIEVQAPLFIKEGETITIDTTTGEYLSRVVS